jgi:DNA-binding NarL/FixJ family response regulator
MRVLVADDHPMVRRGLRESLREAFPSVAVTEAATGEETVSAVTSDEYDVVLMGLQMGVGEGLEVLREARRRRPTMPIVVMSLDDQHDEIESGLRALRCGATGYVSKRASGEVLVEAVNQVIAGGRYLSEPLAERAAGETTNPRIEPQRLSERELEVLKQVAAGQTIKEIAFDLGLSAKTVHTFRARILKKLALRTTADLVRYAIANGLASA